MGKSFFAAVLKSMPAIMLAVILTGCEQSGQHIVLSQEFKTGSTYHYTVQRDVTIDSLHHRSINRIKTAVTLTVMRSVDSMQECSWTYGTTIPLGVNPDLIDEKTREFLNYNKGLVVKFFIGAQGSFQGLSNLEECQAFLDRAYHRIFSGIGDKDKLEDVLNKVIRPQYETGEVFLNTFCQDLSALFGSLGDTLLLGKTISSRSAIRMPVLDTTVTLVLSKRLTRITRHLATISFSQKIAPEGYDALKAGAANAVRKFDDSPQPDSDVDLLYASKGTIQYDINKRAIVELNNEKTIRTREKTRIEGLKISLQE